MKLHHFMITYLLGLTSLYAADVIDYHSNHLHFGNFGEKNEEIQKKLTTARSSSFELDLSENYLDDSCVETLVSTLHGEKALDHVAVLNLTNNRITQKGLLMLAELIMRDGFDKLIAPINSFDIEGIRVLSSTLD